MHCVCRSLISTARMTRWRNYFLCCGRSNLLSESKRFYLGLVSWTKHSFRSLPSLGRLASPQCIIVGKIKQDRESPIRKTTFSEQRKRCARGAPRGAIQDAYFDLKIFALAIIAVNAIARSIASGPSIKLRSEAPITVGLKSSRMHC